MHTVAIAVLIVFALFYVVFAVSTMRRLSDYCDRVAALAGRMQERKSTHRTDEGGENAYEREIRWKLLLGAPHGVTDPRLAAIGRSLTIRIRLLYVAAVLLVVGVAVTFDGPW